MKVRRDDGQEQQERRDGVFARVMTGVQESHTLRSEAASHFTFKDQIPIHAAAESTSVWVNSRPHWLG
jgi:hypothetical protein